MQYQNFRDYDLSAKVRARSGPMVLRAGCQGDIMIDGTCGMHMSNSGMVYDRMWYGHQVVVVTLRCHEGHASHFVSWRLPCDHKVALNGIRARIFEAWGGGFYNHHLRLNVAFDLLTSELR